MSECKECAGYKENFDMAVEELGMVKDMLKDAEKLIDNLRERNTEHTFRKEELADMFADVIKRVMLWD